MRTFVSRAAVVVVAVGCLVACHRRARAPEPTAFTAGGEGALAFGLTAPLAQPGRAQVETTASQEHGHGHIHIGPGFVPDPIELRASFSGAQAASALGATRDGVACNARVADKPDYILDVAAPMEYLRLDVTAASPTQGGDTRIVLRGPDGGIDCIAGGGDAGAARFARPFAAGRYEVWLGISERQPPEPVARGAHRARRRSRRSEPEETPAARPAGGGELRLGITAFRPEEQGARVAAGDTSGASAFGALWLSDRARTAQQVHGMSGGEIDARQLGQSRSGRCLGWIDSRPSHVLHVTSAFPYLRVRADSGGDTTLVVRGPEGIFCDDDSGGGDNPQIAGPFQPGTYEVWVGSYRRRRAAQYRLLVDRREPVVAPPPRPRQPAVMVASTAPAQRVPPPQAPATRTVIVERYVTPAPQPQPQVQWQAQAAPAVVVQQPAVPRSNFGTIEYIQGTTGDPVVVRGTSGGQLSGPQLGLATSCRGWFSRTADHVLVLPYDVDYLRVDALSSGDTTLAITSVHGAWCDDDGGGARNPRIHGRYPAGTYEIRVGSYDQGVYARYNLSVSVRGLATNAPAAVAVAPPPPTRQCTTLRQMSWLASLGGGLDQSQLNELTSRRDTACASGIEATGRETWTSGLMAFDGSARWSYPNGLMAADGGRLAYPNGLTAFDDGWWKYPNGLTLVDAQGNWSLPNGLRSSESGIANWACSVLGQQSCNDWFAQIRNAANADDRKARIVEMALAAGIR